jgi:hypothetical protein
MAGLGRRHMQAVHRLLREGHTSVAISTSWREIHQTFELGEARGQRLHFTAEDRQNLRAQAQILWGFDPFEGVPTGDRVCVAARAIDEKIADIRPDDRYVLVKGALAAPLPLLTPPLSLRLPISSLDFAGIRRVLVIENLDSFDDWHLYEAPAELSDGLVLYRGHGGLAKAARSLLMRLPKAARVTVFPDWDPAGLFIARTLPRADALLVPELDEVLLTKGSAGHFLRQHQAAHHLDCVELHNWGPIWSEMKRMQISIKQQHMLALGSRLRIVPYLQSL